MTAVLRSTRWFALMLLAATLATAGFGVWITLRYGGTQLSQQVDDLGQAGAAVIAAALCGLAAWRHRGRTRVAWSLVGVSALSWATGESVWSYYQLRLGQPVPFPSVADAGFLGAVPFAVLGVLLFPAAPAQAASRLGALLDGLIIAGSLLVVSWATVLGTVYRGGSGSLLSQAIGLAYPTGDVIIATIALLLVRRAPRDGRGPLLLLAAGLLANLVADSSFALLTTANAYGPVQASDTGWVAGYLLIGLAALRSWQGPIEAAAQVDRVDARWRMLLPYVPVGAAALATSLSDLVTGSLDPFLFWNVMAVTLLVVIRQYIMLTDNVSLSRQLKAQADVLREREEHFRSLVQNSSDLLTLADRDGIIRFQSASVERILAYPPGELVNQPLLDLVHPDDRAALAARLDDALKASALPTSLDCRIRHKLGTWSPCEVTITNLLHLPSVQAVVLNIRDVTERKVLEEKLTHQAYHDTLTNLANRTAFRNHLEQAVSSSRPEGGISVLFLDLDEFKSVNDSLGHEAGDQLLAAVGARLERLVQPIDIVARLGGDEFAVLLQHLKDDETAARVAERILRHFRPAFLLQQKELFIRVSIGIASLTAAGESADELLRNADVALYMAKARGKARYERYEPTLRAAALDRMELDVDLQHAMQHHEFLLHYQPAVTLESSNILFLEALVRWNHPKRGLLLPRDFIALAEENGLMVELGRWILRQACREGRRWQLRYPARDPLLVSVNMTRRQLQDPRLIADVTEATAAAGLDPHTLVLELSESALLDNEAILARLQQLSQRGVKLALDNFGTGYSSLASLRDLPIDLLKLDHSFVARMSTSEADAAVVRAVITLGNTLGLMTVADGIERAEQFAALNAMGCRAGQGYFMSRPLPADEMDAMLAKTVDAAHGRQLLPAWRLGADERSA